MNHPFKSGAVTEVCVILRLLKNKKSIFSPFNVTAIQELQLRPYGDLLVNCGLKPKHMYHVHYTSFHLLLSETFDSDFLFIKSYQWRNDYV